MKNLRFIIEYALLRAAAACVRVLPWKLASDTGGALGRTASLIIRKRFRLTLENIAKAFPQKSAREIENIALLSWENLGRTAFEFAKASAMPREEILKICKITNAEKAESFAKKGGILVHLGHIANWELAGLALGVAGFKISAVAR
ncbi:MAG: hypothetical protein NTW04_04580, partial [Elusimicrobia bacterium]|nr:hypothetical protein [Elusimicrobiota bacterium]